MRNIISFLLFFYISQRKKIVKFSINEKSYNELILDMQMKII